MKADLLDALREMRLDAAIRPKLMDAVAGQIVWEEFRDYLRELEAKRLGGGDID